MNTRILSGKLSFWSSRKATVFPETFMNSAIGLLTRNIYSLEPAPLPSYPVVVRTTTTPSTPDDDCHGTPQAKGKCTSKFVVCSHGVRSGMVFYIAFSSDLLLDVLKCGFCRIQLLEAIGVQPAEHHVRFPRVCSRM